MPTQLLIGVSHKGITIIGPENEAVLEQYLYVDIASWGYSSNAFVFVAVHEGEEQEHVFKTTLGKRVNDLISSYVKYIISSASRE